MSKKSKKKSKKFATGYGDAGASFVKQALRAFNAVSSSPDQDIDWHAKTLRQRSRMLYMASPVATSAINTNRTKIVGVGLTLQPLVKAEILGLSKEQAKEWQLKTAEEFAIWADKKQNCDALGVNNFDGLQQLAVKSWLMSGDAFALIKHSDPTPLCPYGLRIHLIEADRVSTPSYAYGKYASVTTGKIPENKPGAGNKVYDGVEVDKGGHIIAYHVCNVYPNQMFSEKTEWTRVTAYGEKSGMPNILQIMESERPDAYRGVPYLAQIIEPLLQLRRYTEAELMAAIIQCAFTAWITTQDLDTSKLPFNSIATNPIAPSVDGIVSEEDEGEDEDEYEDDYQPMVTGEVFHLKTGEDVKFGNPNIPTASFDAFTKALCRMMGAALELPYDVLMKEYNSSYSAARAALQEAWEAFRMRRVWLVDDFCQPVYELWLAEAIARGRIKAPGFFDDPRIRAAWSGAQWIGPVQSSLDPKKEAEAAEIQVRHAFKTHSQITREQSGGEWEANIAQLRYENELVNKQNGDGTNAS